MMSSGTCWTLSLPTDPSIITQNARGCHQRPSRHVKGHGTQEKAESIEAIYTKSIETTRNIATNEYLHKGLASAIIYHYIHYYIKTANNKFII